LRSEKLERSRQAAALVVYLYLNVYSTINELQVELMEQSQICLCLAVTSECQICVQDVHGTCITHAIARPGGMDVTSSRLFTSSSFLLVEQDKQLVIDYYSTCSTVTESRHII
jgi:hypothetical protein